MTIEERVERLEGELARAGRRNRWLLTCVLLGIGAGIMALLLCWTTPTALAQSEVQVSPELRARAFLLVDENGKTRAELTVEKHGPALTLKDENGDPHAMLNVTKNGAWLVLAGEKEKSCSIALAALNDGAAALALVDKSGNPRAGLRVDKDGPGLRLLDTEGKAIFSAP